MDTRHKIVDATRGRKLEAEWKAVGQPVQVVVGHFDPLLAGHAAALEASRIEGGRLIAVITDPPEPILPAPARAALVAGLAVVDAVVIGDDASPFDAYIDLTAADLTRRSDFVEHVRRRNAP